MKHEQVPGWVACFDIGILAETGFYMSPLKLFEWMAAGRAIGAPNYAPSAEIIENETHGLLFAQGDQNDLVAAVLRLVDEPEFRRSLGSAAADRVRSNLTWNDNARRVLAVCERALNLYRGDRISRPSGT